MADGESPGLKVDLRLYPTRGGYGGGYDSGGRSLAIRITWLFVNVLIFLNPLMPSYRLKVAILKAFGAEVGEGVKIKPSVNIKYPWFLTIGDHCWIGERVWLDCTAPLRIGSHVVISQGVYLCCGTHDWQDPGMGSISTPITIHDGAWIAAFARIAGNVTIGQEAMVAMGAVVFTDCEPRRTYRGNPAQMVGRRRIRDHPGPLRPRKTSEPAPAAVTSSAPVAASSAAD